MTARPALLVLLLACSKAAPSPPPPDAVPAVSVLATAAPVAGPVDPLAIVLDGKASALPEDATEPGRSFDPSLREKVAPQRSGPVQQGNVTVDHGLPVVVVQRIVRQNFGRFRLCYQKAIASSPDLAGTLDIAFTVDHTGAQGPAERKGGTLDSAPVTACVIAAFAKLSFPVPEGSPESHVVYGLAFDPDS